MRGRGEGVREGGRKGRRGERKGRRGERKGRESERKGRRGERKGRRGERKGGCGTPITGGQASGSSPSMCDVAVGLFYRIDIVDSILIFYFICFEANLYSI